MDMSIQLLIVEDSYAAQQAAKRILNNLGCLVDVADNSESTIKQCNRIKYDVILMDLGLYPDSNGFLLSKRIKTQSLLNQETPIIALSIHSEAQFYQQIKNAGIIGFISKPFTQTEAIELLEWIKEKKSE